MTQTPLPLKNSKIVFLVTKLTHTTQLLNLLFAKMVEPTTLTLHKDYGCYPRQFSFSVFHILLSPSPPSMANSEPTTVNTTNGHKTRKKKSQPKENPTISYSHKKKKFQSSIPPPTTQTHLHYNLKLQTTTTNTKNSNTPTQNLQIGDPKLPTQTHKHRKLKSKPRNP